VKVDGGFTNRTNDNNVVVKFVKEYISINVRLIKLLLVLEAICDALKILIQFITNHLFNTVNNNLMASIPYSSRNIRQNEIHCNKQKYNLTSIVKHKLSNKQLQVQLLLLLRKVYLKLLCGLAHIPFLFS